MRLTMTTLSAPLNRLARLSRVMEIMTDLGIVLVLVLTVACFLIPDWSRNLLLAKLGQGGAALPLTPQARLPAALVLPIPAAVIPYVLPHVPPPFPEFR